MFILKEGTSGGADTTPELRKQIMDWLTGDGLTIRDKAQDKAVIDQAVADATKVLNIDGIVKEVTAIERTANESLQDYVKRSVAKKLEEITALKAKVTEYEAKGADGSVLATEYKERLKVLQQNFDDYKTNAEKDLNTMKVATFQNRVDNEINIAVSKLTLRQIHDDAEQNTALQETLKQATIQKFKNEFTASEVEGMIVFKDKQGSVVRKKTDASFEVIDELIKPFFDPILQKGHQQGGAGSGGAGTGGGKKDGGEGKNKWQDMKLPAEITSQVQLLRWLKTEHKLEPNTKEFDVAFDQFKKTKEGTMLPTQPKAA